MKKFKWVIEIEVDETWVADGFDLRNDEDGICERAKEMVLSDLSYADSDEVSARVIKAPPLNVVMKAQGFSKEDIATATAKQPAASSASPAATSATDAVRASHDAAWYLRGRNNNS